MRGVTGCYYVMMGGGGPAKEMPITTCHLESLITNPYIVNKVTLGTETTVLDRDVEVQLAVVRAINLHRIINLNLFFVILIFN